MNRAFIIGNLTRDPELRTTSGTGSSVCSFTVAVSRRFANQNGERETDFIPVVAWKSTADNCAKYLLKGSKVAVSGSIQTRSYDDKEGQKRYVTEIVADEVQFLNKKGEQAAASPDPNGIPATPSPTGYEQGYTTSTGKHIPADLIEIDDDLPF